MVKSVSDIRDAAAPILYDENDEPMAQRGSGGAAHVTDGVWQTPRLGVVPTISSSAAGTLLVDSVTGTVQCVRAIINPGTDVLAATYLAKGTGDVRTLFPDSELLVAVDISGNDGEITDIYLLAVGDGGTDGGGDNIVDTSTIKNTNGQTTVGTVSMFDVTSAEILAAANMVRLQFDSVDKVRGAVLSLGRTFSTDTQCYLTAGGRSYA